MELKILHGNLQDIKVDTLLINLFEGTEVTSGVTGAIDKALGGAVSDLLVGGDMSGKAGEVGVIYSRGAISARRVIVVGLGKPDSIDLEGIRKAAAAGIKRARELKAHQVATVVPSGLNPDISLASASQAIAEGSLLALYRYDAMKHSEDPKHDIQ